MRSTHKLRLNGLALLASLALMLALCPTASQATVVEEIIHSDNLMSELLGYDGNVPVYVSLPPGYEESDQRYPTVYHLHGAAGFGGRSWLGFAAIESKIRTGLIPPMIVVAPNLGSGPRSFFTNSSVSGNTADFVAQDLVAYVDRTYRTIPSAAARGLAGESSGGGGALGVVLKRPRVFSAVYARSPGAIGVADLDAPYVMEGNNRDVLRALAPDPEAPPEYYQPLIIEVGGEEQLVRETVERMAANEPLGLLDEYGANLVELTAIRFDVGTGDRYQHIPPGCRAFSAALDKLGIDHEFVEYDGNHDSHQTMLVNKVLPVFFGAALKAELVPEHYPEVQAVRPRIIALAVGDEAPVDVSVMLAPAGQDGELYLDLSRFGGAAHIALEPQADGSHAVRTTITPPANGHTDLPIWFDPIDGDPFVLEFISTQVWPGGNLEIMDEGLADTWAAVTTGGAENPVPFGGMDGAEEGGVTAITVASNSFLGWKLGLEPSATINNGGYETLAFWFHPGTASGRALNFGVNRWSTRFLDEADGISVDLTRAEWQRVEIPLSKLGIGWPLMQIQFNGSVAGTFYIDGMRLVTADGIPRTPTAIEERSGAAQPQGCSLSQNYPNPFNSGTVIPFALSEAGHVELAVLNLLGQRVAGIVDAQRPAGTHAVSWDGRDDNGRAMASGLYLYRLDNGRQVQVRRLLLLR